jgi:hypothetical protein
MLLSFSSDPIAIHLVLRTGMPLRLDHSIQVWCLVWELKDFLFLRPSTLCSNQKSWYCGNEEHRSARIVEREPNLK